MFRYVSKLFSELLNFVCLFLHWTLCYKEQITWEIYDSFSVLLLVWIEKIAFIFHYLVFMGFISHKGLL